MDTCNKIYQYSDKLFIQGYDKKNIIKICAQSFNYSERSVEELINNRIESTNFSNTKSGIVSKFLDDMKNETYSSATKIPGIIISTVIISLVSSIIATLISKGLGLNKIKADATEVIKKSETPEEALINYRDSVKSKYNIDIPEDVFNNAMKEAKLSKSNFSFSLYDKNNKTLTSTGKKAVAISGAALAALLIAGISRVVYVKSKDNSIMNKAISKAISSLDKDPKDINEKDLDTIFNNIIKNLEESGIPISARTRMELQVLKSKMANNIIDRDWALNMSESNFSDQIQGAKALIPANGNSAPPSSPLPPEMQGAPDPTQDEQQKQQEPNYQVAGTPGMDPNTMTIPQVPVGDQNIIYQPGQRIMDDKGNMGTIRTGNTKLRDNKGEFFAVEVYWDSGKCDFISTAYVGIAPTNQEIQEMAQQQQQSDGTQEVNQSETFESSMEEKLNYLNGHGNYEVNKMIKTPNNSTAKSDESNFSLDGDKLATQLEIEKFKKYGVIKDPATGKYVPGVSFTDQMAASIIESTAKGVASTLSSVVAEIVGTSVRELNNIVKTLVRRTVKGDFRNAELNKEAVSKVQTYLGKMIEESNPTGANVSSSTIAAKRKGLYIPPSFQAGNYSLDAESDEDFEKESGEVDKNFRGNYSDSTQNIIQKRLSGIAKSTAEKGKMNTMRLLARAKSEKAQAEMVDAKAKEAKAKKASFSMLPSPKDGLYVKRGLNAGALSSSLDSRKTDRNMRASTSISSLGSRSNDKIARDSEKRRQALMKKDGIKMWSESDIVTPVSDINVIKKTTLYGPGSTPIDTGSDLVKKVEFSDVVNKNISAAKNIDVENPEDAIKNLASSQISKLEQSVKNANMSRLDGPAEWFVSSKSGVLGPLSEGEAHSKYLAFSEKDSTTRMYKDSGDQVGFSNFSEKSLTLDEKIDWLK